MPAATARRQTTLKRLAGALAFLCLVLVLLAVEQRHTVAAWQAVQAGTAGLIARIAHEGPAPSEPVAADPAAADIVLAGPYAAADEAARDAVGGVAFVAAQIRFDSGEALQTRPLRIARAADGFAAGQTYAGRLSALPEAQIELREVVAPAAQRLCDGAPAVAVGLRQQGPRVDLMLFRARPESTASSDVLCGVWSFARQ